MSEYHTRQGYDSPFPGGVVEELNDDGSFGRPVGYVCQTQAHIIISRNDGAFVVLLKELSCDGRKAIKQASQLIEDGFFDTLCMEYYCDRTTCLGSGCERWKDATKRLFSNSTPEGSAS